MKSFSLQENGGTLKSSFSEKLSSWFNDYMESKEISTFDISVVLCSDESLLEINKQFLNHDYYTDIITFEVDRPDVDLAGELFISIDRVKENSSEYGDGVFENEFVRVVAHGALHLMGFGDKEEAEISTMREEEAEALSLFLNT